MDKIDVWQLERFAYLTTIAALLLRMNDAPTVTTTIFTVVSITLIVVTVTLMLRKLIKGKR